ncbi:MAG TPA: pectin acetylesterase-family hydrolase [Pseudomonadales bacterium]|nr:pectin acetylesterase-family hydrolase [Pseudomonadales bacterium]
MHKRLSRLGVLCSFTLLAAAGCGGSGGAGEPSGPAVEPIVAAADTWTWVDFPDSKCASGSATGIGINPHAGSKKLVIYLEGGGSCNDAQSCWVDQTAAHVEGYAAAEFAKEPKLKNLGLLSRDPGRGSPFTDANMIFVPYCTGDWHAGYNQHTFIVNGVAKDTYFWGGHNIDLYLARLAATFPDVEKVWLTGTSAGGAGTITTYFKVHDTFNVRTDVINDSGTPLALSRDVDSQTTWGVKPAVGCETCDTAQDMVDLIRRTYPETRYAFISFEYDNVLAKGYGISLTQFNDELNAMLTHFASDANFASFTVNNALDHPQHVVMGHYTLTTTQQQLQDWLTQMANDEPWGSVNVDPQ